MGLTIKANKSSYEFDMGASGFFHLRKNIAWALDSELGRTYANILKCHTNDEHRENDRMAENIINEKHLDAEYDDVLDFLYASDVDGKISYTTCGKIYDLIKDIDFGNKCFRYTARAHNDYEEFKAFLKECYTYHRNMYWH